MTNKTKRVFVWGVRAYRHMLDIGCRRPERVQRRQSAGLQGARTPLTSTNSVNPADCINLGEG